MPAYDRLTNPHKGDSEGPDLNYWYFTTSTGSGKILLAFGKGEKESMPFGSVELDTQTEVDSWITALEGIPNSKWNPAWQK